MQQPIQIICDGSTVLLPAGTQYEREILCEHLRDTVRRHGEAKVIGASGALKVTRTDRHPGRRCSGCGGAVGTVVGSSGKRAYCIRCTSERSQGSPSY